MDDEKPRANTFLILLTLLDLVGAAGGSAPFITYAKMTGKSEGLDLLFSVPAVAIGLVIVAWTVNAAGRRRIAQLIAALPIIWGMAVFVMLS